MTQTVNSPIKIKSAEIEETDVYGNKLKKIFFGSLKKWNGEFNSFKSNAKKSKNPKTFQKHDTNFKKYVYNERLEVFSKILNVFKSIEGEQKSVDENFLLFLRTMIEKGEIKLNGSQVQ
jgi:hypothetical protein